MDNLNLRYIEGFAVQQVGYKTWAIDDFGIALMYLVEGDESAVLIDTGMGMGNLKGAVGQITRLPVKVVNTHGHIDHAGGNDEFKGQTIYIHQEDEALLEELREKNTDLFEKNIVTPGFYGQEYYDMERMYAKMPTAPLCGGDILDLGNRYLEVIEVPGHTKGSIVLLDRENGYLFSGDAVVSTPTLIVSEMGSTELSVYREALERLNRRKDEIKLIFPGHYLKPIENTYISELITVCDRILDNSCEYEEFNLSHITEKKTVISRYKKASVVYVKE